MVDLAVPTILRGLIQNGSTGVLIIQHQNDQFPSFPPQDLLSHAPPKLCAAGNVAPNQSRMAQHSQNSESRGEDVSLICHSPNDLGTKPLKWTQQPWILRVSKQNKTELLGKRTGNPGKPWLALRLFQGISFRSHRLPQLSLII